MEVPLKESQKEVLSKIHNGCILVGDTGAGKTRTALAYFDIYQKAQAEKLYVITTAKKRDSGDWEREYELFENRIDICVDSWNNVKKYIGVENGFFIFDEQRLVGSGVWVQSFYRIAKKNGWILLTATPGDCWLDYIPVFVANGYFRNRTEFMRKHCVFSRYTKFPSVTRYLDEGYLNQLKAEIVVYMDSDKETEQHHIDIFTEYDMGLYKSIMKFRWNVWKDQPVENAAELCQLLRRVCNSDESRVERVIDILREKKRAVVFYNYDYELELLRAALMKARLIFSEWNGHRHEDLPEGDCWAYLVQYNAGAEGWNCITTDTLIFFSQNYSYKMMVQSAGRIDRLNTPYRDLYYYHMKTHSPIDRAVDRAIRCKKDFNEKRYFERIDISNENRKNRNVRDGSGNPGDAEQLEFVGIQRLTV